MELTSGEERYLLAIQDRIGMLREILQTRECPDTSSPAEAWYQFLWALKQAAGNSSNDLSFIACWMAKSYLEQKLPMRTFDAAAKPQGAPGLDIDEQTIDGGRVIGEVKTTTPFKGDKGLGASQAASFAKDFAKLQHMDAEHKFFFITDRLTFDVTRRRYSSYLRGVTVVLLPEGDEYTPT